MITIEKVIKLLQDKKILKEYNCVNDLQIDFISYDSRNIKPNTLFFCKGQYYKIEYLDQAIEAGAILYVSEEKYDANIQHIIVSDIQKAMAIISAEFYGYAFKDLQTIGITGTKGKSTVSCFMKNILDEYTKSKTAISSSIYTYTGTTDKLSQITTPESVDLQKFFYEAKENNCKYATIEVSSQGYKKDRVYGIEFNNGVFLNIAEDHISPSEHKDFNDYLECKIQLVKNSQRIILNKNIDYFNVIYSECKGKKVITVGTDDTADYYYNNVKKLKSGFKFDVICKAKDYKQNFEISMQGRFNIENALVAITLAKELNVDDESIKNALLKTVVKGRMNVFEKNGITVIVDHAHNKLSYTKLYESLKLDYPNRRIISVGGCMGEKAFNRRKEFGTIVGGNSDYVYLTSTDPQFENPEDICKDIALYIEDKNKYEIITDRKTAVETAIANAKSGDVVVLLGKAEAQFIRIKGIPEKYESDLLIAKRMLKN